MCIRLVEDEFVLDKGASGPSLRTATMRFMHACRMDPVPSITPGYVSAISGHVLVCPSAPQVNTPAWETLILDELIHMRRLDYSGGKTLCCTTVIH